METDEKSIAASNMVLISLMLGLVNIFIQGIEGAAEFFLTLFVAFACILLQSLPGGIFQKKNNS